MRFVRRLLQFVFAVLTFAAVMVAILAVTAYRAVPHTRGTVQLAASGLKSPVTIVRDARGVPTIAADSEDDAIFALGYVHAQDRLFEMELTRRSGQGRLSEIIGKPGVSIDRFVRTLGLYRRAADDLTHLDPAVQRVFQRYADGVNAWLKTRDRPLPLEFQILWFTPEPWTPVDSLVWQKLMGLQLSGNWDDELLRAALDEKLGPERAEDLWAKPRLDDPITVPSAPTPLKATQLAPPAHAFFADLQSDTLLRELLRAVTPTLASNAWAVAGSHTASGKPLLANDPHLGFQIPSLWYFAILKTPDQTFTGATVPGVPLFILGHNDAVAWAITTTHGDTQDLFIEHVLAGGKSYETPDGPADFITRGETIAVRFGNPVTLTVRETRHGPVLSDVLGPNRVPASLTENDRVLALSATLLAPQDHTADALYRMAHAHDVSGFRDALRQFDAPEQNVMFADQQSIGFVVAGRVPLRKSGDGTVPAPGWNGDYDWTGWAPFESLPQVIDPSDGVIVNSNNRATASGDPLISVHWPEAYRARRILDVLHSAPAPLTAADMSALQTDTVSIAAQEMLPLLLPSVKGRNDEEAALLKTLAAWDGNMARDRAEPLVFAVWMDRLKHALLADGLGALYQNYYGEHINVLRAILTGEANHGNVPWCDAEGKTGIKTCAERIQNSWNDAIDWIAARENRPVSAWRWDDFHRALFDHQAFKGLPIFGRLTSRSIATPGGDYTINRGSYTDLDETPPLAHVHGPGMRAVYDLGDLSQSRFALAGGESGLVTSPHYDDLLASWRDGITFPLVPVMGDTAGADRLTLVPSP